MCVYVRACVCVYSEARGAPISISVSVPISVISEIGFKKFTLSRYFT